MSGRSDSFIEKNDMANRHLSRSVVLQSLFEWDFGGHFETGDISLLKDMVLRNANEFAPGLSDFTFMHELAESVAKKRQEIDHIIEKAAPEWPIPKISVVDRNVLRIGLFELLFGDRTQVPAKVAINEAIELAKTFGGENSGKFVNGVLGSVYKEIGEPGKDTPKRSEKKVIDPKTLPLDMLVGAVVYARVPDADDADGHAQYQLALVHDIFGHWTLSKGHLKEGESEEEGLKRILKEEMVLEGGVIKGELASNEYVANDPEKGGKLRKQVKYFLVEAPFTPISLGKPGGLDDAKWFPLSASADLNFYNDILPIITKAVTTLLKAE